MLPTQTRQSRSTTSSSSNASQNTSEEDSRHATTSTNQPPTSRQAKSPIPTCKPSAAPSKAQARRKDRFRARNPSDIATTIALHTMPERKDQNNSNTDIAASFPTIHSEKKSS